MDRESVKVEVDSVSLLEAGLTMSFQGFCSRFVRRGGSIALLCTIGVLADALMPNVM